jgi:acyl-CoA synthetase (NDP forming)
LRPSREALADVLRSRRIAVVGASDNSRWSLVSHQTAMRYGFPDERFLVNRRGRPAHGATTATSCRAIGTPIDVALLLVKGEALPDAIRDAAEAGATSVVALASGFGEAGVDGARAQSALVELADELGLALFGPNCLGFVNYVDRTAAWAAPAPVPRAEPGSIALVSQSGAIAIQLGRFAAKQSIRFSHVVSTGNEAMIGAIDVAETLVEDDRVRCLALFVESIPDVSRFDAFAARGAELGKPIVMLKAGRSSLTADLIASHTGSLAGDDRIIDAALRQAGVVRVDSLEELVLTAGLFTAIPRVGPGKLGIVSISGGACDIAADAAEVLGTPLATLSDHTVRTLTGDDEGRTARNPFDVTGAAVRGAELMSEAVAAVAADPDVGLVAIVDVLPDGDTVTEPSGRLEVLADAMRSADVPCVLVHQVSQDTPVELAGRLHEIGATPWIAGIDRAVKAAGHLIRRSAWSPSSASPGEGAIEIEPRPLSELETLTLLEQNGIPAIEARLAATADDAVAAARAIGYPVVVKVSSPAILHKSEVGGVVLDLRDDDAVRAAVRHVTQQVADRPDVDGVVVAPMRTGGLELIVGVVNDPAWGLVLAVGLGGIWVEALDDSILRRVPVGRTDVEQMLSELRGRALLEGARGGTPADIARLADVVVGVAHLAERLGPRLESLEINPLRVDGAVVEALDAALTWR